MGRRNRIFCSICKKKCDPTKLFPLLFLSDAIFELIKEDHPKITRDDLICSKDLGVYRARHMELIVRREKKIITEDEQPVIDSFIEHKVISENVSDLYKEKATFGERLADQVAAFVGSWAFIISFHVFLFVWVIVNTSLILARPIDPYPYIFLNLILSMVAAIQAPLIMMSQNRQEAKDRLRSDHDYKINLKAELEIRHLSTKIDRFMHILWEHLEKDEKEMNEMRKTDEMRLSPEKIE